MAGEGRLILNFRKDADDGIWKILVDVDNNDEVDAVKAKEQE